MYSPAVLFDCWKYRVEMFNYRKPDRSAKHILLAITGQIDLSIHTWASGYDHIDEVFNIFETLEQNVSNSFLDEFWFTLITFENIHHNGCFKYDLYIHIVSDLDAILCKLQFPTQTMLDHD
jgi:hypothetical protein